MDNRFLLFIAFFIAIIWFILRQKKEKPLEVSNSDQEDLHNKVQEVYETSLSKKEKFELSWDPIRRLAEYIMNKFSGADKNKLLELGHKLLKHGAKYIHVIDYALPKKEFGIKAEIEKDQGNNKKDIAR